MKLSFATVILTVISCSFLTTHLYSQETLPSGGPFVNEEALSTNESKVEDKNNSKVPKTNRAWEPKLHVFLNEKAGGSTAVLSVKVVVHKAKTVLEKRNQNGQVVKVPRIVYVAETEDVEVITAGVTVIDCDAIDIDVKSSEEGEQTYEFEITGQLLFRNGGSRIEAKSAKLSDGKLTLTDVTLTTAGITLSSSEVVLDLKVDNLRIGDFTPNPIFAPIQQGGQPNYYNDSEPAGFLPMIPSPAPASLSPIPVQ